MGPLQSTPFRTHTLVPPFLPLSETRLEIVYRQQLNAVCCTFFGLSDESVFHWEFCTFISGSYL